MGSYASLIDFNPCRLKGCNGMSSIAMDLVVYAESFLLVLVVVMVMMIMCDV